MSVSSSDCSMIPSSRVARASSASGGAAPSRGLADQPVQAAQRTAPSRERQVERGHARPEGVLAGGDRPVHVRTRVVAPGDDDGARHPDGRALLPLGDRRRVDRALPPGGGGHDEQRGVGRAQAGAQLTDEVAVTGGVDEIDLRVGAVRRGVHEGSDGQRDRALLADGCGIVIAHSAAVDDGACPGNRAGVCQEGLDERGLPRAGGSDEDDVADPGGVEHRRCGPPCSRSRARPCPACSDRHGRPPPRRCVCLRSHTRAGRPTSPEGPDRAGPRDWAGRR